MKKHLHHPLSFQHHEEWRHFPLYIEFSVLWTRWEHLHYAITFFCTTHNKMHSRHLCCVFSLKEGECIIHSIFSTAGGDIDNYTGMEVHAHYILTVQHQMIPAHGAEHCTVCIILPCSPWCWKLSKQCASILSMILKSICYLYPALRTSARDFAP